VVGPGHQDDKLGAYHRHDDKPVAAEPEGRAAADAFLTVASRFAHHNTHPTRACLFILRGDPGELLIPFDHNML